MMSPNEYAGTVLERCDQLAAFTEEPGRVTRRFATPALRAAGEQVQSWMEALGMRVRRDAIGNVIGRLEGSNARTLLLGSHLDTVRSAGRYDGILGVLVALACLERLQDADLRLPYSVEVLAFADEEGVRYGTGYLGSGVVAGRFDPAYLERRDGDGVRMADALREFGGDPSQIARASREASDLLGYYEVHIEQGPVLEAEGLPIGVVSAIAGQTRATVTFSGEAGHAGTVPMALRRDALCAAAEWIVAAEGLARSREGLVATVGELDVSPGAGNTIPGRVRLSLDVRHAEDPVREGALERLRALAAEIAGTRGVSSEWQVIQETPAVACSPELRRELSEAVGDAGHRSLELASGAGHDAAIISALAPVAMLFVRCAGGISHNAAESVTREDVAAAIDVSTRFLERLA